MASTNWVAVYDALAGLVGYPTDATPAQARRAVVELFDAAPELTGPLDAYAVFTASKTTVELEELFTRTFDINPTCALEVGWHLYGEEYMRGAFLVKMHQEQRRLNVPTGGELSDHLSHVLATLARMEPEAGDDFARRCVMPAVTVMTDKLTAAESPFTDLLFTIYAVLAHRHAATEVTHG
jgi:nitrate reductase delta subunit